MDFHAIHVLEMSLDVHIKQHICNKQSHNTFYILYTKMLIKIGCNSITLYKAYHTRRDFVACDKSRVTNRAMYDRNSTQYLSHVTGRAD